MYLVICITNYGSGLYTAGVYRSLEKAQARMEWCEKHTVSPENDSWQILYVRTAEIKTAPIYDGYGEEIDLKHLPQRGGENA